MKHSIRKHPRFPASFRKIAAVAGLALLMGFQSCDSRAGESEAEADRNQLIILSSLLSASTDFEAACNRAVMAGFACAENLGIGQSLARTTYAQILQLSLGLTSTPDTGSASSTCQDLYASPILARATGAARVCYFNCEANFWNTAFAANPTTCNAIDYSTLASNAPGEVLSCFNDCVRNTSRFYY